MEDSIIQLNAFLSRIEERGKTFIGYPGAADFDYSALVPLLRWNLNNVGDPMVDSHCDMHTKDFERDVLCFFAGLFNAPPKDWWGYVTNGGSEGNLYGLYLARQLYPEGMVYYSEATHYSVQKNINLLGMRSIVIRCDETGEVDYDDLEAMIQQHRQRPAILLANIGTTMTEAKDDVPRMKAILRKYAVKHHYIHCDAALAGIYLALIEKGRFDFRFGADSISVSGHKFIGSPIPCGVVLVRRSNRDRIGHLISYIGTADTTITGSRNAITPVFLWYAILKLGRAGLLKRAVSSLELAAYATARLKDAGVAAWRNADSLTVVFPQPVERICRKWQLASEGGLSHLITMPGVGIEHIDAFVSDLVESYSPLADCDMDAVINLN
ncbi:MAG: histidine decarboxylase [Flavisolibacter sp.]